MALRLEELAKTIDHTLLRPTATVGDVDQLCEEARAHHVAAVCVLPYFVPHAVAALESCDVKVGTVVSFPFGADSIKAKLVAAEQAIAAGARELAVVINLPALLSGDFRFVCDEVSALVQAARVRSVNGGRGTVLLKLIAECGALDDKLQKLVCRIAEEAGVDFVETSTGQRDCAATTRDVELLRECLPGSLGVKASGSIETVGEAEAMVAAGATRLGTSHAVAIMQGFTKHRRS